jgi:hypothetical protein
MQTERARLLTERLHADDFDEDGTALREHIRRVVREAFRTTTDCELGCEEAMR